MLGMGLFITDSPILLPPEMIPDGKAKAIPKRRPATTLNMLIARDGSNIPSLFKSTNAFITSLGDGKARFSAGVKVVKNHKKRIAIVESQAFKEIKAL